MKYYKISEKNLKRLVERDWELETLEAMGVDNWEGYGEEPDWEEDEMSVEDFINRHFKEIINDENN
jgi:hypothetical protein